MVCVRCDVMIEAYIRRLVAIGYDDLLSFVVNESDIHMSVHRDIIPNYSQRDTTFLVLFISTDSLHVSGGSSAHHQEHITVHTASGIVNQYCC